MKRFIYNSAAGGGGISASGGGSPSDSDEEDEKPGFMGIQNGVPDDCKGGLTFSQNSSAHELVINRRFSRRSDNPHFFITR
jgi:predicted outer membrane repeat protein